MLPKTLKYGIGISGVLPESEVSFDQTVDYHVDASKGLELYTWKEAVAQEEIAPILQGLMESEFFPNATNYYSGSAQALFRSGLVVYVQPSMGDDGVLKEERLTLDTLVPPCPKQGAGGSKGGSADIIVVIIKEGAKLALTSALSGGSPSTGSGQGAESIFARTMVVLTERDASVRIVQKEMLEKGTTVLLSARGIVAAHSSCVWNEVFAGDIRMKSETDDLLIGEQAKGEILQGIIAEGSAHYDIFSSITHVADHTHSRIRAAGFGAGVSKTVYRGMIEMPARRSVKAGGQEGVHTVDGSQEARFLVLSPKAEVDAIPSLDIASQDVRCTHKLSVSHIRDTDTFYPKLRGLSNAESRTLFLEGHFAHVFSDGENEEIMERIREHLVS